MMLTAIAALQLCGVDLPEEISKKGDQQTLTWVKRQLKEDKQLEKMRVLEKASSPLITKKCATTTDAISPDTKIPIYVMISFSVPEETWVSLSKEMEKIGSVFVLRGLPNNSFKELSRKIQRLNTLGVRAPIQINPAMYTTYQIDRVPTFLIADKGRQDSISGNISLSYAIEKMGGLSP